MRPLYAFLFTLICWQLHAQKPRIVVGIVVDQMRQDYLYRYADRFEGGFKRLTEKGYQFKNAHYDYIPTKTAPGHASVYTGTTPANHGIIANDWYSKSSGLNVYCVSDPEVKSVGGSEAAGKMSPKNLMASTITDELIITSNFRSKVVGVSIKDRGSILPAGHHPTGAYWFDSKTGHFITSDYYHSSLPQWAANFNGQKLTAKYLDQTWTTLKPIESYVASTADNVPYEQTLKGKDTPTFPYDLKALSKENGPGLVRYTPWGNTIVMDFALAAIEGEDLGADDITDFLAISFSSTDYAGHSFGTHAIEIEDMYLRLDMELERLFKTLDKKFGDDYVVFLTADHGAALNPTFSTDHNMVGGLLNKGKLTKDLNAKIKEELGEGEWIANISNEQIFLNRDLIKEKKLDLEVTQEKIRSVVLDMPEVFEVYTSFELEKRNGSSRNRVLLENGFNTKMSGDLMICFQPGYINWYTAGGTTHGSGFVYDTHVPILFYGSGVPQGTSVRNVHITDIAPTLSMLLNISLPNAATGTPLHELFK